METRADDLKSKFQITLTDEASLKIKEFLDKSGRFNFGLRLRVVPSIEQGHMFEMDFESRPTENDVVIENGNVKIFISKISAETIKGSTIEFYKTMKGSCFRIRNTKS